MRCSFSLRTATLGPLLLIAAVAIAQSTFATSLGRMPVDRANSTTITGTGHVTASLAGAELSIRGEYSGLGGAATTAAVHLGVSRGVRGPQSDTLNVSGGTSGEISGTIRLDEARRTALEDGRMYIQVHSEAAPEGNLWGWLLAE